MNIGVAIFIIAMHIIAKLVVLGSFLMVGSRGWVVGWSWGMVDSMVHWVGNHWGSMGHNRDNWGSMVGHRVGSHKGSMVGHRVDNWGSMMSHWVDRGLVGRFRVGLSLVSDISNEAILMVSVVGHNLYTAVRKLHWNN